MLGKQLISVGRELYESGLQTTRSGNVSVRDGSRFLITKTGANLGRLKDSDLIAIEIDASVAIPMSASSETRVHRAVYDATDARAIVHAHPAHAIALAQVVKEAGIQPIHNEGLVGLKWIPIIDTSVPGQDVGERPDEIAEQLRRWCTVVIRGHGAFAVGPDLDEALYKMILLETVCTINCISKGLTRGG